MEIEFPLEFLVHGTPVSAQATRADSRESWKARIKTASTSVLPVPHFASEDRIAVTLYYLPEKPMQGDVDNIVKLVLDALNKHIYLDDSQVERLVVQKFEPDNVFSFAQPTPVLARALTIDKPVLYVRISNDPFEELG